jgi:act minimal PKS chain-length factor (CLF/KS beta)
LADAGVSPDEIGLWFPSRNGVANMDRAEADVMREVFGQLPRAISVKDAIGEMAASGGGQLVAATRATADPEGPFPPQVRRRALVNSFGAGGNFLAAVVESVTEGER